MHKGLLVDVQRRRARCQGRVLPGLIGARPCTVAPPKKQAAQMAPATEGVANRSILKIKRKKGVYETMAAKSKSWKTSRSLITAEHYDMMSASTPTYVNIDAPPSTLPTKKYCDITGLPAKYTDPVTKLRYVTKEAFRKARSLADHKVEEFLALRKAQVRIK